MDATTKQILELQQEQEQESILAVFLETHEPKLIREAIELQKRIEVLLACYLG